MYELLTSKEIQVDIAAKIKSLRLQLNQTQESFSKSIDISKATYMRFENRGEGSFENFVRIMHGIGRISELDRLLKVEDYSPIGDLKNIKKTVPRKRASTVVKSNIPLLVGHKEEKSFLNKIKEAKNE